MRSTECPSSLGLGLELALSGCDGVFQWSCPGGGLLSGRFFVRDRPAENLSMETGSALPAKQ